MVYQTLIPLIEKCREETDVDSQIKLLCNINQCLPHSERIDMPSFMTDDYCRRALEIIEDRVAKALSHSGREFSWP